LAEVEAFLSEGQRAESRLAEPECRT
jgi:hypothetical protein